MLYLKKNTFWLFFSPFPADFFALPLAPPFRHCHSLLARRRPRRFGAQHFLFVAEFCEQLGTPLSAAQGRVVDLHKGVERNGGIIKLFSFGKFRFHLWFLIFKIRIHSFSL